MKACIYRSTCTKKVLSACQIIITSNHTWTVYVMWLHRMIHEHIYNMIHEHTYNMIHEHIFIHQMRHTSLDFWNPHVTAWWLSKWLYHYMATWLYKHTYICNVHRCIQWLHPMLTHLPERPLSWLSIRRDSCLSVPSTIRPPAATTLLLSCAVNFLYSSSIACCSRDMPQGECRCKYIWVSHSRCSDTHLFVTCRTMVVIVCSYGWRSACTHAMCPNPKPYIAYLLLQRNVMLQKSAWFNPKCSS